jgi:hypothetical protein
MNNTKQYGKKKGVYMGPNTCYINSSFQLLTSIPEFNEIFLTNENYDNILYIGETVNIITATITERVTKNQNMTQFFKDVEQIVGYIINDLNGKNVKECFSTIYQTLIGIPNEIYGFQSARDLINNFIDILKNLQVPSESLNIKIKNFVDQVIISIIETKRCHITNEIKTEVSGIFNLLEIKAPEDTNLQKYINDNYNQYILQEGLLNECGNKQNMIDYPIAQLDASNNIIECRKQVCGNKKVKFCINSETNYYNEYLKKLNLNKEEYAINARPKPDCNGRELKHVSYGPATYGQYERYEEITLNKYIIITLPMELYGTNNRTLYIEYQGKLNIINNEYILQGSIFHTGNHYVYQTYDGIGGTTVINTYDDNNVIKGAAKYIGGSKKLRNTAILLYKRKEVDTFQLKPQGRPSDEIINSTIKTYCNYKNKINIYGNIYKDDTTSYIKYLTKYPKALLIINDNYKNSKTDKNGGGNASGKIRNYNIYSFYKHKIENPQIAGITTGPYGEYTPGTTLNTKLDELDSKTPKEVIDDEIKLIKYMMIIWDYKEIIYSSDINGNLGTEIFAVPDDIKEYIKDQILNLGMKCYFIKDGNKTIEKISKNKYINILN